MSQNSPKLSRRTLFVGASTVGALAAVATVLPKAKTGSAATPMAAKPPPPERGGGYHLSEHVKQYYKTTMI
jgi:hypothetical protein